jgi:hypothetical protein
MKKKILNNAFCFSMIWLIFISCNGQTFSPDKFIFDSKLDSLFKAVSNKDTIFFENSKNGVDTFVLTKIDSIVVNLNRTLCIMCPRSFKTVFRNYKQYPTDYWAVSTIENRGSQQKEISKERTLITITKSPQNDSTTVHISFKNFECEIQYSLGKLLTDTLTIGDHYFSNYYILTSYAKSLILNDADVELIYVNLTEGVIAYKEKSGLLRKRIF